MEYRIFGCKTNKYFTDKWLSDPDFASKPGIFVASCVVTENAKRKWKRFVKKAAGELADGGKIYLSGCGSLSDGKVSGQFYEEYPELRAFRERIELLPEDSDDVPEYARRGDRRKLTPAERIRTLSSSLAKSNLFTRKYSVIQTGCDNLCTFCLTVAARGAHKWRPAEEIVAEIAEFAANGGAETVLTGTNVGAWGAGDSNRFDEGRLPDLLEAIWSGSGIRRVRVSSLGPEFLTDAMLRTFVRKRSHAYVHLSVQSGSDSVLRKMRRKYGREFLRGRLSAIRGLRREDGVEINIGADLIVGFPGETDADFEDTLSIVREFGIAQVHAFPFSAHEGMHAVPASKLPNQISDAVKSERMDRLSREAEKVRAEFLMRHDGRRLELLPEGNPTEKAFSGWSENHIALSQKNFVPDSGFALKKGVPVSGVYRYVPGAEKIG